MSNLQVEMVVMEPEEETEDVEVKEEEVVVTEVDLQQLPIEEEEVIEEEVGLTEEEEVAVTEEEEGEPDHKPLKQEEDMTIDQTTEKPQEVVAEAEEDVDQTPKTLLEEELSKAQVPLPLDAQSMKIHFNIDIEMKKDQLLKKSLLLPRQFFQSSHR